MHTNIEIKARCDSQDKIREVLKSKNAVFKGKDKQKDIYFNFDNGRFKLREGNIENCLIYYKRDDKKESKKSDVSLLNCSSSLKSILEKMLGVLAVVEKEREIYFIDNVKFHIDNVKDLGTFVEIEAIGNETEKEKLLEQCNSFMKLFGIKNEDLIANSYSDMIIRKNQK